MTSLAGRMPGIDATIFAAIGETAVIDGQEVKGIFTKRYREIEGRDGSIVGLDISFDCQHQAFMDDLAPGDTITIKVADDDAGVDYKFRRQLVRRGDESGLIIMELASA